ncbi:response regulator [Spirosoma sp. HMF3257]|uniref:DNA-binding response regulator n=1 Tax=Spirosoma telluris TaxID=2183553 RepID=A0A327NDJ9_9BACT|nr:response regulator [Spirosoma telluris]RAI73361.1 DNA-binding response regulator [Spirosoma telluris]
MKSLRILIIEDELVTAHDIRETLEKAGHKVTDIARNLPAALTSARINPPDLALIDIHLEHATDDGIDIAQRLLTQHTLPIIFLTGHSEQPTIARAQQTRPAAYLLKPFRHKELAIQIELAYYNYQATQTHSVDPFLSDNLYLPVDQGKGYVKIKKRDVLYLQADRAYVEVHLIHEEQKQVFSMNLGYISQFFTSTNFYNLSRSLLVNLDFVERIDKSQFYVQGRKQPVPFPENNHKLFLQQFAIIKTPPKRDSLTIKFS